MMLSNKTEAKQDKNEKKNRQSDHEIESMDQKQETFRKIRSHITHN